MAPVSLGTVEGHAERPDQRRRWRRRPGTAWRRTLSGLVVLGPGRSEPVAVTGSVGELWALLERPRTVDELVTTLSSQYEVAPARLEQDVAELLHRLDEAGVLDTLPPG
jgi:hypothetical protein